MRLALQSRVSAIPLLQRIKFIAIWDNNEQFWKKEDRHEKNIIAVAVFFNIGAV